MKYIVKRVLNIMENLPMLHNLFKKNTSEQNVRDLLRENLSLLSIDLFLDDPIIELNPEQRKLYLKFFFDLNKDLKLIERIKYNINKQAVKTINNSKDGVQDLAGACNINGMAFVLDEINRLANMYIKELAQSEEKFDKFEVIPKI